MAFRFSFVLPRYRLSTPEQQVLVAMAHGATLKVHRTMDGRKEYRLHPLHGDARPLDGELVAQLRARGFLDSNMKFPAATFMLTIRGLQTAAKLAGNHALPLGTRNYTRRDARASVTG